MLTDFAKPIVEFLKGLPTWVQVLIAIALCLILFVYVGRESIDAYIDKQAKIEIERTKQKEREKLRSDSLRFRNAQKFWQQSINDELELRRICKNMDEYFTGTTQMSLFKLHDHGDILAPENNPRVTVKWSNLNEIEDSYQNEPVYTGGLWAMDVAEKKGFLYMPDLKTEENYWIGREKAFHQSIKSKSSAFIKVKDIINNGVVTSKWYIALHWKTTEPYNDPYTIRIKLERFVNLIKDKIYIVPDHLSVY